MRTLGYSTGENIHIETRLGRANTNDLAVHTTELAGMDLDFVVVAALPHALAMRQANPGMPMVIITCPGMVSNGFAESLERPGGIYTGMEELPPGVTRTRLQLLKRAAPSASRIALLSMTPGRSGHETQFAEAELAANNSVLHPSLSREVAERTQSRARHDSKRPDGWPGEFPGRAVAHPTKAVEVIAAAHCGSPQPPQPQASGWRAA